MDILKMLEDQLADLTRQKKALGRVLLGEGWVLVPHGMPTFGLTFDPQCLPNQLPRLVNPRPVGLDEGVWYFDESTARRMAAQVQNGAGEHPTPKPIQDAVSDAIKETEKLISTIRELATHEGGGWMA